MPCGTFGSPVTLASGPTLGVDAVTLANSGAPQVLVTYVNAAQNIESALLTFNGSTPVFTPLPGPLFQGASGEPALAADTPSQAMVVFKAASGQLQRARYTAGIGWTPVTPALGPTGQPFNVNDAPGIVFGRMPGDTTDAFYLHAWHSAFGGVSQRILKLDATGQWVSTPFFSSPAANRPGLAYVPNADGTKGKMYAVYPELNSRVLLMRTSGVRVTTGGTGIVKTPTFDFVSRFNNGWAKGWGVDLMFERGYNTILARGIVFNFRRLGTKRGVFPAPRPRASSKMKLRVTPKNWPGESVGGAWGLQSPKPGETPWAKTPMSPALKSSPPLVKFFQTPLRGAQKNPI